MCLDCFNAHQLLNGTLDGHKVIPVEDFKVQDREAMLKRQLFFHKSSTREKSHDFFALIVKFAFARFA